MCIMSLFIIYRFGRHHTSKRSRIDIVEQQPRKKTLLHKCHGDFPVVLQNDKPLVEDLFLDLRDGEVLLSLLEILTAQQYVTILLLQSVYHLHFLKTIV